MKIRPLYVAVGAVLAVLVPAGVLLGITSPFSKSDRICKGVTISGIEVGGLPRSRAAELVRDWAQKRSEQPVVLTALDRRWEGTFASLGARVEWQEAVDNAYAVGREGSLICRAKCIVSAGRGAKHFQPRVVVNESKLSAVMEKVAKAVNRPHKDARIRLVDGRLEIEHDAFGIKLEEEKAIRAVSTHLSEGKFTVALPIVADKPRVTDRDAKQINTLLATFTTRFNAAKRDRTHNLILAAKSVDGLILKPDEQFSYNNVVGERLASRGYKDAPIFVKGKLEPGLGGGVCQVSSTIYNSVLLAGLKIKERYPHSRTVPYVKPGRDATVAYGYRDFRFENSNSSPVCLISRIGGGMLTIDVYGASQDKKSIELFTGDLSYTDVPGEEIVVDAALKSGQRKVVDKGARGVRVILYRKTTLADGSSVTEVVSKDRYPAQKKIVAISPVDRPKSTVIPASRNATGSAPAQIRQD